MTEQEWVNSTDPNPMLEWLWNKPGNRKLRLFAAACCRHVWNRITDPTGRQAIESVEQFAEGKIAAEEMEHARQQHHSSGAWRVQRNAANAVSEACAIGVKDTAALVSAVGAAKYAAHAHTDKLEGGATSYKDPSWRPLWDSARKAQAGLVLDIFGNPFRPVTLDPTWLTTTVKHLAEAIYADRAFERLPILADALEDAGCTNADILNHCREPGVHVRGCWVVDLLLGKE